MKRLIFILSIICVFALGVKAQESATYDKFLGYEETWMGYFPAATTRATTTTDSIWYFTCLSEKYFPVTVDVKLKLDSISGTARHTNVYLKAKKFDSDTYTNLDTIDWHASVDTSINFNVVTDQRYRYFQVYLKTDLKGFIINIDELSMKFWQ